MKSFLNTVGDLLREGSDINLQKNVLGFSPFFFLTYDMWLFFLNVPVRTCLITLSMICLHLEQKNNTDTAFISSLLHAFFGSVLGGIEEIIRGLSLYEGSLRDCNSGDAWTHEWKQYGRSSKEWGWDPGCGENARSTFLKVFNPTATILGISISISFVISTPYIVAKFINTEKFLLFVTGDVNKRDAWYILSSFMRLLSCTFHFYR